MRWLVSAAFVSTLMLPYVAPAQDQQARKRGDRLFLSAGPGRTFGFVQLTGVHFGAEYSLTPLERVVGVRVHLGALWTPSQNYSRPSILYGDGSTVSGFGQEAHLDFGVTGSVTPWPRGRLSPYLVAGVAALQRWSYGSSEYRRPDGTLAASFPPGGRTRGLFTPVVGAGLRFRVGGRRFQIEARRLPGWQSALGLGTALRF